jgi:hypothetical protein
MSKKLSSVISGLVVAFIMVFSTMLAPLAPAFAVNDKDTSNPNGNNGTLKVHELGTASGTESNDPKVCAFNFEGFDFDENQDGYIMIDTHGGSSPLGVSTGPHSFGPTDSAGYAQTTYFNNGGATVVDGTYKATLYGKDSGGNIDLTSEKAKSKVFKVDCPASVTPAAVTFNDLCGTDNDTYTIPETEGVDYKIGGVTVDADTYDGVGKVTVNAVAQDDFTLTGTTSWEHTFTNVACVEVIPHETAPLVTDLCGEGNATWNKPDDTNVLDWEVEQNGHLTVTIIPANVTFPDGTTTHDFETAPETNTDSCPEECPEEEISLLQRELIQTEGEDCEEDVCVNIDGVQSEVPTGMEVDEEGNCSTPGGVILGEAATTTPQVQAATLVNTGSTFFANLFMGLFILGTTAVLSGFSRKRSLDV